MSIRTGSLSRELAQEEPEILAMILEDYVLSRRRERASRLDFASGWLAALRRLKHSLADNKVGAERVPW